MRSPGCPTASSSWTGWRWRLSVRNAIPPIYSRFSSSTSTASRTSTTASVTVPAINCWSRSRGGSSEAFVPPTPSPSWARTDRRPSRRRRIHDPARRPALRRRRIDRRRPHPRLAWQHPFELGGKEVFVGASIGIALGKGEYESPEDILRDADTAMYSAKAQGKARFAVFDDTMRAKVVARLQLENDLRRALERGEFRLNYQPILSHGIGPHRQLRGAAALESSASGGSSTRRSSSRRGGDRNDHAARPLGPPQRPAVK